MSTLDLDTNLVDPALFGREGGPPYGLFDAWRERDPVHWNPPNEDYRRGLTGAKVDKGFWVLTRYQDVYDVSRNAKTFCSHVGGPVIWDMEGEQLMRQQVNIMGMPLEQHRYIRRLATPPFSPRELERFQPDIDRVARDIVDEIASRGECEFVFDVASKLPVYTFCTLMGIPEAMHERVFELGNELADVESRTEEDVDPALELFAVAQQVKELKRAEPDRSIFSRLVNAEGEQLDDMTLNMFFLTLAIAGHETTRNTASHFVRLMNEHPDQYELLLSDVDRYLPNAIEEVLRYAPPVTNFRRTALEDTQIGDQEIRAGDKIYLSYPAANRDPEVFEDPERFDITRSNAARHLSFGTGPHICIGARLAQLQLRSLFREVVTRIADIRLDGDPEWQQSIWFNSLLQMPVRFTAES